MQIKKMLSSYRNVSPAVKAGLWFTLCNMLQKGISFITVPIFTRIMSTDDYGLYSIYISWYSVMTIFATLHLSYYVFNKGLVKFEDDREEFVISLQSLSATVTLAFIFLYIIFRPFVDYWTKMPPAMMICMLIQIFFEPPVLYWTARKRFEYKYQAVVFITVVMSVINPLLGIVLIKLHCFSNDAIARTFSMAVVAGIFGFSIAVILIRKAHCVFSMKYWKYALCFNLPLIPHYLSTTILSSADRIMIGDICGKTDAAIYSVAYAIGMVCTLFSQAIHQAYLPWLYKRMKERNYNGIPRVSNAFLLVILGVLSLLMCFAPEVVLVVGSRKYMDAMWAVPPVCGSIFFIFLQNLFANIEYYFEKTKLIAIASVGVAALNVLLNYIYVYKYGYIAAAYTTLICYFVYAFIHFWVMWYICRDNDIRLSNLFDMRIVLFFSLLMTAIVFFMLMIYRYTVIRYTLIIVIICIVAIKHKSIIKLLKAVKSR